MTTESEFKKNLEASLQKLREQGAEPAGVRITASNATPDFMAAVAEAGLKVEIHPEQKAAGQA